MQRKEQQGTLDKPNAQCRKRWDNGSN